LKNKIGIGYDLHRLESGRPFRLGGVAIPSEKGPAGHSDADALIHAVIDALLGASGEGDIGALFPDTDPVWKNALSTDLLRIVMKRLKNGGYKVLNVDSVVVVETPRIGPHVPEMKAVLCPILGIPRNALGIKGKTNEGMGSIGNGEAVACWATALLETGTSKKPRPKRS
jgi:2-C-methyl-D-erythritol 2,4-cyclodiphosphate synthase